MGDSGHWHRFSGSLAKSRAAHIVRSFVSVEGARGGGVGSRVRCDEMCDASERIPSMCVRGKFDGPGKGVENGRGYAVEIRRCVIDANAHCSGSWVVLPPRRRARGGYLDATRGAFTAAPCPRTGGGKHRRRILRAERATRSGREQCDAGGHPCRSADGEGWS